MRLADARPTRALAAHLQVLSLADFAVLLGSCSALVLVIVLSLQSGTQLPDLRTLEAQERKTEFFGFLEPIVVGINNEVRADRAFVLDAIERLEAGQTLSWSERGTLEQIASHYEVETGTADLLTDVLPVLRRRVGVVPRALVLVQAAKESGWGTSRFAVEGNNLFGQRCYTSGCGMKPAGISSDADFGVAQFGSIEEAVESYVRNLNTHAEYEDFRKLRESLRRQGTPLSGTALADSLAGYSERGEEYVAEIKALIRQNDLEPHD